MEERKMTRGNPEETEKQILELVKKGYKNKEIANQTGISFATVCKLAAVFRKLAVKNSGCGINADRHLCMTCKYRSSRPEVFGCDYIGITGHRRGCKSEDCMKYEKGRRRKAKGLNELDGEIGGY